MRRKLKRILVLIVLLPVLMLSSCLRIPVSSSSAPPSPSLSVTLSSPETSPAPTNWHSGVKTDYAGLTPYQPPEEKYTRLSDGAMPAMTPSDKYGELLPYIGEMMYNDGGWYNIRKYGLMTTSGMLITDPVYSGIYQGTYYSYSTYKGFSVPVYSLEKTAEKIDKDDPWASRSYAVCALDGSWITPFAYTNVAFYDKAMMLIRDYMKNDIDVVDYNGRLLYNTASLSCYSALAEGSAYNYGDGIIAASLKNGGTVFIDLLTGKETYADYTQCSAFAGGFAAVMQDGLTGYINKDFTMVIQPQFSWGDFFTGGKSVVQYPDGSYAIIDQNGNVLLKNQYSISRWDSSYFGVYDIDNNVVFYDTALNKVTDGTRMVNPVNDGWFSYPEGTGITVFKGREKHTFSDVSGVQSIVGDFVTVYKNDASTWQEGLMTLDGKTIIPMTENLSISIVTSEKTGETFVITGTYDSRKQSYTVYDSSGGILISGSGYASLNTAFDLFEVYSDFSYAYIDTNGNDVFRISLMEFLPD